MASLIARHSLRLASGKLVRSPSHFCTCTPFTITLAVVPNIPPIPTIIKNYGGKGEREWVGGFQPRWYGRNGWYGWYGADMAGTLSMAEVMVKAERQMWPCYGECQRKRLEANARGAPVHVLVDARPSTDTYRPP